MNLLKLLFFSFLTGFYLILFPCQSGAQNVHLNEIMSSNLNVIADEDGDYENWIEIYNSGPETINLEGFGLSDDYDRPFRWVFPDTTLSPGEFMLIWASGKHRTEPGSELHTNFGISFEGEEVLLTNPDGSMLDDLPPVEIPGNHSIGRQPDGSGDWLFFPQPTPGFTNFTEGFSEVLEPPVFSHSSGFYSEDITLEVSHPDPDVSLYYTLDGTIPNTGSNLYTEAISFSDRSEDPNELSMIPANNITTGITSWLEPAGNLNKGNIIRVKAIKEGAISTVETETYFIFDEGPDAYQLPVVSIVTEPDNLFDEEIGIYVPGVNHVGGDHGTGNYEQRGIEWERQANIKLFEKDGSLGLSQEIGLRIHGGWTRRNPLKSLRLYARSAYDESRFNYKMFEDLEDDSFNRFILRGSGNDFGFTMFMDAAAQSLIRHFNVDTQAYRPVIVFINGEYWGIHNVRERYDRRYLERVYGADPDNIDLLTARNTAKEGSSDHYDSMIGFVINNDLSNENMFEHLKTLMDIDNFLDYYSAQIYYGNDDWPHNNIDFWRSKNEYNPNAPKGLDGRWRWLLYDVDRSLGFSTDASFDMIEWVIAELNPRTNAEWPNILLKNLLENDGFYTNFINRISDHLNTAFSTEWVTAVVDSLKAPLEPVIDEHIHRWQNHGSRNTWENRVQWMYTYANDRPDYLRQHMKDHLNVGLEIDVVVDVSSESQGFVTVNTTDIISSTPGVDSEPYPWSGIYFSDVPVTLTAQSKEGYTFSHWETTGDFPQIQNLQNEMIEIYPEQNVTYTAHFSESDQEEEKEVIHYWVFTDNLPNDTPLEVISPVFSSVDGAILTYEAAVSPYPPAEGTAGILDRVNDSTEINYISEAFGDIPFEESGMRGIRARNPSLVDGNESALVFSMPTTGYESVEFTFAAVRTGSGQELIKIDYSTDENNSWTTQGLELSEFTMFEAYKEVTVRFEDIEEAANNEDFKIRVRFGGDEDILTSESGNVRFNNVSLSGFAGDFEEDDADDIVHYWVFDDNLPNNTPLETIDATYSVINAGMIEYRAAISPYPPDEGTEGILDRVNDPTIINYFPSGNFDIPFAESDMRGVRARNPSLTDDAESALILHLPSDGFEHLNVSFAANRTGSGQELLLFDYSVDPNGETWTTAGLEKTEAEMFENYRSVVVPLDNIEEANNNSDLKFRIRFGGDEEIRRGSSGNVRFNNVALRGADSESVSIEDQPELPERVTLSQNYPNPFNPVTVIEYAIPGAMNVSLTVYDIIGRRVAELVDEHQAGGTHQVQFDASNLSSGMYIYRLVAGEDVKIKKMTLIK